MGFPLYYPQADTKSQNFVKKYPGRAIKPNVLVLHTMEVDGWPGYSNGGVAPHLSLRVWLNKDGSLSKYAWRQHFPFSRTARAVRNKPGGVETNNSTQGVIQVELAGTCGWAKNVKPNWSDPDQLRKIGKPLIDFLVFCNKELGIQLVAPYPFYAWNKSGQRMTNTQWMSFKGICGHQHVPENIHVDPGLIDINWLIGEAKKIINGTPVANNSADNNSGTTAGSSGASSASSKPTTGTTLSKVKLKVNGSFNQPTIKALQKLIKVKDDGVWGPISRKAFQKWLFVKQDGIIGPNTVKALQKRLKLKQSGKWDNATTKALQEYLNLKMS